MSPRQRKIVGVSNRGSLAASPAQSFPPAGKPQPTSLIAQGSEEHYKNFPKNFTPKSATRKLAVSADAAAKHVIVNRYFPKDSKFAEFEEEEYYNWNTKTQYGYFANPPDPKGEDLPSLPASQQGSRYTEEDLRRAKQIQRMLKTKHRARIADTPSRLYNHVVKLGGKRGGQLREDAIQILLEHINITATDNEIKALIHLCSSNGKGLTYLDCCHSLFEHAGYDPDYNDLVEFKHIAVKARQGPKPQIHKEFFKAQVDRFAAPLRSTSRVALMNAFKCYDHDSSGIIKAEELYRCIKRVNPSLPDQMVAEVISAADTEQTGLVNYQELIAVMLPGGKVERTTQDLREHLTTIGLVASPRSAPPVARPTATFTGRDLGADFRTNYENVLLNKQRDRGTKPTEPNVGSPSFASSPQRYEVARTSFRTRADPMAGVDGVGCCGKTLRESQHLQAKLRNMRQHTREVEERRHAAEQKVLKTEECRFARMEKAKRKTEETAWVHRYPFDHTWIQQDYKHNLKLPDLVGHQRDVRQHMNNGIMQVG
mmetsp:Transcript_36917/g.62172  ORF Transcript_36917/g.62172 Transcript_36917/m.62172 type:complete len:540 (+) Transcript_36917:152-1771(+)|eukprot:CAMPEP_0198208802 /NCGR_PEP_ID=MMETSP1445-20131203/12144_1 /TAXON_ID=36898 /ORGANISM="Pyramimonas sp., Strain CCMP2087" /LENGTH=539 /DNA_ID=CAMNT_0043882345 /DNA_START=112 /DNA_END=1731 /DNA_ORIENTATION=+